MAEKRVSVRLAVVGGRQVRAELEGVGEAGVRGFGRLGREMEAANARLAGFSRRVGVAVGAAAAAAAAAGVAMVRSGLSSVDAQAKLARSLGTTVASIQTLERAGELAGVSMSGIEQAAGDLTRRLRQAAAGTGPAADALDRLGLSATELIALPLDQRVAAIAAAIESFAPAAERAAVAGRIFGEQGSQALSRLDTATLRQATEDLLAFGVVVSDRDAAQIERTNDAVSRLGLIWRGVSNQLAVAAAPALEAVANAMAAVASRTGPLGAAIRGLFDEIGRLTTYAATFAAFLAGRWVVGVAAAALSVRGLATALVVVRGALIRTGIGALIVGAGELVHQFARLVSGAGGFGAALGLLGDVARAVWSGIGETLGGFLDRFRAAGRDIEAIWLRLTQILLERWAGFLGQIAPAFNAVTERLGVGPVLDPFGATSFASSLDGAILRAETAATVLRAGAAARLAGAFDGVGAAVAALVAAVGRAGDDAGPALAETAGAAAALEDALARAGGAAAEVAEATVAGAEALDVALESTARGWEAVRGALDGYAKDASNLGADLGDSLTGAFRGAEAALAQFVRTGKLDFAGLVSSMIADLATLSARSFMLGPLSNLLSGALGSVFSAAPLASPLPIPRPVRHAGGIVGGRAPMRLVPDAVFAGAPRLHAGGWAGLRPDEVPAILQRGERVLSRREAAGYGGGGGQGGGGVVVHIHARDAESFRQSRTQIAADIARAVAAGRRGL